MKENVDRAVKLYSGDRPMGLFVDRLKKNLNKMNEVYDDIVHLFDAAGIDDFKKLPDEVVECAEFAKLFRSFNKALEAAKIQGFKWGEHKYSCGEGEDKVDVELRISEDEYLTLAMRYKELASGGGGGRSPGDMPFDIDGYLTEIDTDVIDAGYMNSRFDKYLKALPSGDDDAIQNSLSELHRSFAQLPQEEQKFAEILLRDVQRGDVDIDPECSFKEYIIQYQF